jgi:hypothetical protein
MGAGTQRIPGRTAARSERDDANRLRKMDNLRRKPPNNSAVHCGRMVVENRNVPPDRARL